MVLLLCLNGQFGYARFHCQAVRRVAKTNCCLLGGLQVLQRRSEGIDASYFLEQFLINGPFAAAAFTYTVSDGNVRRDGGPAAKTGDKQAWAEISSKKQGP